MDAEPQGPSAGDEEEVADDGAGRVAAPADDEVELKRRGGDVGHFFQRAVVLLKSAVSVGDLRGSIQYVAGARAL